MKCFKIILSYILGIILFLTLNLMGVLLIIKNTFNETTLTNIVDNINIYDIVIGNLLLLSVESYLIKTKLL